MDTTAPAHPTEDETPPGERPAPGPDTATGETGETGGTDESGEAGGASEAGKTGGASEAGKTGGASETGETGETGEDRTGSQRPRFDRRLTVTVVLTLVLALTGAGLLFAAHRVRDTPAAANHALTDTTATTQVTGDISTALAKIFSYTPDGTEATRRSAAEALRGRAAEQYERLFGQVRERVAEQRLTLTTQVVRAGVERLTDDSAELLVFLDQTAHRDKGKPTHVAAQLSVTAQKEEGQWRIVEMTAR